MKTVAFHNLGCKVNSYEMDAMLQKLKSRGYTIVSFEDKADIYIVNTCTVTNMADRKSRQMLHKAKKTNPEGIVVAVGCYVQTDAENVERDPCVDLLIGNNRKKDLVEIIEKYMAESTGETDIKSADDRVNIIDINDTSEYEEMKITATEEHTRAYIKIQDGCNQFCTYCMIPFARGRVRSRRQEDIVNEIKGLVKAGYKEFVLTGIHISSYGIDFDGEKQFTDGKHFIELLRIIDEIDGVERLRIGSLEPRIVTEEFAGALGKLKHICPHFHLSLQSGCESTLKRMNRHYTPAQYKSGVELLRKNFEHPAITTDVIVGFPGETEEEFGETRQFLEDICFYEMHIFKYSKRKGTSAAVMENQVPEPVKTKRSNILLQMEASQSRAFREYYVGKECEVLIEEKKELNGKELWIGHTKEYVKIAYDSVQDMRNKIVKGKITGVISDEILYID